jgi:hypothetical protein
MSSEENATHVAVGTIGEPVNLAVYLCWAAGERGFRLVLKELDLSMEYGAWDGRTEEPMPSETLSDAALDLMVREVLYPLRKIDSGWTSDPVSPAQFYALEWGWKWVPEKLAPKTQVREPSNTRWPDMFAASFEPYAERKRWKDLSGREWSAAGDWVSTCKECRDDFRLMGEPSGPPRNVDLWEINHRRQSHGIDDYWNPRQ